MSIISLMKREYGTRLSIAMHVCLERDRSERVCDVIEQRGRELLMESERLLPETEYARFLCQPPAWRLHIISVTALKLSARASRQIACENDDAFWSAFRCRFIPIARTSMYTVIFAKGRCIDSCGNGQKICFAKTLCCLPLSWHCNKTDKKIPAIKYLYNTN